MGKKEKKNIRDAAKNRQTNVEDLLLLIPLVVEGEIFNVLGGSLLADLGK